jgi:hypothetical protein
MLIKGYVNQLCGETPPLERMGVPSATTNFDGMTVTLTHTRRKVVINAPTSMDKTHVNWRTC